MGVKMIMPGVYEFDPETPDGQDDFEKRERLFKWSNIPPRYRQTHRISTFEIVKGRQEGYDAALEFLRGDLDPPFLMMVGTPGRSKTHLAVAIGLSYIGQLRSVLFYHVGELLDDLRAGIRLERVLSPGEISPKTATSILQRCQRVELLVLDDLGVEKETDWACEKLDTIVNHRYEYALPTVITANTLDVSDRIRDRCIQGRVARLEGESYRAILANRRDEKEAENKKTKRTNKISRK